MKICFLTSNTDNGTGGGRYASDLIEGVRRAGNEVIVLTEQGGEHPILHRGLGIFTSAWGVRPFLQSCDVVHALDIYPFAIIAWFAGAKNLVITALGTYSIAPFYQFPTNIFARIAIHAARAVVAISTYTKSQILKKSQHKKIEVINPGIDVKKFSQVHQKSETPYLMSVGALKYRKGHHISIPAFAEARKSIPNLRYVIVGDQDDTRYLQELQSIIRDLGIEQAVELKTHIAEVELLGLYRKADLFVLTSVNEDYHVEGFGLVFLEAAASGVPVVGTLGNGISDAVSSNGKLVPQGDIGATAHAITSILSDRETWDRMSAASAAWASSHSVQATVNRYIELYSGLIYE